MPDRLKAVIKARGGTTKYINKLHERLGRRDVVCGGWRQCLFIIRLQQQEFCY
jgi:hypothetical protein